MAKLPCPLYLFSGRRRHTSLPCDWSSDVCSSDLEEHTSELQSSNTRLSCDWSSDVCSSDRKSTRLNSSHTINSYAVFCLKNKVLPPSHSGVIIVFACISDAHMVEPMWQIFVRVASLFF